MAKILVPTIEDLLEQTKASSPIVWVGQEIHYRQGTHISYASFYAIVSSLVFVHPSRELPIQYRIMVMEADQFSYQEAQEKLDKVLEELKKSISTRIVQNGVVE